MTTKEVLVAARKLIEKEENWTTEHYARNADGVVVFATAPDACKFCALGAVMHVSRSTGPTQGAAQLSEVCAEPVHHINDKQGHAAVLALYDRAIAACEG